MRNILLPIFAPSGEYIAAASVNTSGHSGISFVPVMVPFASRIHSGRLPYLPIRGFVDEQHLVTIARLPDGRSALALPILPAAA